METKRQRIARRKRERREQKRLWYERNKTKLVKVFVRNSIRMFEKNKARLAKLIEFKCQDPMGIGCQESDWVCLEFHHKDPNDKSMNMGKLLRSKCTDEELRVEVERCQCLCANCHNKWHAKLNKEKRERDNIVLDKPL